MIATVFLSTAEEAEQKTLAAARLLTLRERNSWLLYRTRSRDGRETRSRMREEIPSAENDTPSKPFKSTECAGWLSSEQCRKDNSTYGSKVSLSGLGKRTCSCGSPDCASGPRRPAVASALLCGGPSCKFLRARLTQRDPTQPGCTTPCLLHHEHCPPPPLPRIPPSSPPQLRPLTLSAP